MKNSMIISASKPRILRNGKIVTTKKKSVSRKKIKNKLSFNKRSSNDISNLNVKNKNMVNSNYNHMIKKCNLIVLFSRLLPPIHNKDWFDDQNNNHNTNYTKVENYIKLNELQIYNTLEPKIDECQMLTATKETKQTRMTSNCINKNNDLKAITCDHSIVQHNPDVRVTRGKTIQLRTEERKQLDQIMFDKFPNSTFKMFAIQLCDINKEVKFLRTLGLICRFKCSLTSCKIKKKT